MKQKSKIILLLFVITGTLFVSCNLEEEYTSEKNHQEKMKIYHKTFSELLKNSKFNNAYSKVITKKSEASKTVMEEQYQFTITNGIANVAESANETFYTLLIERDVDDPNSFENLIIKNDSLNQTSAFIIKYSYSNPDVVNESFNIGDPTITKEITPIVYNATESTNVNSRFAVPICWEVSYWVCNYAGHTDTGVCTHGYEATVTICDWGDGGAGGVGDWSGGDGNGSDGGGGGGGTGGDGDNNEDIDLNDGHGDLSTVPVVPEDVADPNDPCNILKASINKPIADTTPAKTVKTNLEDLVSQIATNPRERMYSLAPAITDTNQFVENYSEGPLNGGDVTLTLSDPISILMHCHYNIKHLSIFSLADIQQMFALKEQGFVLNNNSFLSYLVTAHGTKYVLKFNSSTPSASNYFMGWDNDFVKDRREKKYEEYVNTENTKEQNEKGFLNFLKDFGVGVEIYKTDNTFSQWSKLTLNSSGQVVPVPCP
jgi:hypothetical protein